MSLINKINSLDDNQSKFDLVEEFYKKAYMLELQKENIRKILNSLPEKADVKSALSVLDKMEI